MLWKGFYWGACSIPSSGELVTTFYMINNQSSLEKLRSATGIVVAGDLKSFWGEHGPPMYISALFADPEDEQPWHYRKAG